MPGEDIKSDSKSIFCLFAQNTIATKINFHTFVLFFLTNEEQVKSKLNLKEIFFQGTQLVSGTHMHFTQ